MRVQILIASLLSIALGVTQVTAQTSLTARWEEGDKFSYRLEDLCSISSNSAKLNQSLKLDTSWQIRTVRPDGQAIVEVQIERVRFQADQKGIPAGWEQLSFDSQNPIESKSKQETSTFGALRAFVGAHMEIAINEKREVSSFELSDSLRAHLEQNQITQELAGFFGHTFTTNGMRRRMTSWLISSPKKPVPNGETWRKEQTTRYEDYFHCIDSFTSQGIVPRDGRELAKIDVKSEIKLPDGDENKQEAKIVEQSGAGVVYIDEQTGHVVDATLRLKVLQEGAFFKMSVDTTINSKLLASPRN